ncbi:unnamed protein product [Medioppia subpectinata]|uniref:ABC-type glutathione-S-conjugate transporter n=1 Tax=Medioppia subpectinata TaxID=1979941 RepID=A0A7R9Q2P9_9ACAR|nr:unnamed protein product [Medioppia subpectinata]CAG2109651.1 unnamed protein product [Medioppia subpectinata]
MSRNTSDKWVVLIYQSLNLSSFGRKNFTLGEIVNLMSVDIQRISDFMLIATIILSAPFQITIAMILLWQQLGVATLAGVLFLVILMPFNGYMANKIRKYHLMQMKIKDNRIKILSETLNGIRVIKLYAWEKAFSDQVLKARDQEVNAHNKMTIYSSAITFMFLSSHLFICLISFMAFALFSPNNILDANKANVRLFTRLGLPLGRTFELLSKGGQCLVSLNRINDFINAKEVNENTISNDKHKTPLISIKNATFSWNKNIPPVLKNITLEVFDPKLVAVVGSVGAGKSSLLSALFGELEILEGSACVNGSVAYVPQEAWIQNKTLKENIVFTNELNDEYYERVLESCALVPDLAQLSDRDLTEIGEKKQRVSMARAVYSDRDIYLLDDPLRHLLFAVDTHVGKHLFDKTIGRNGLLKNKIRILVTNCVSILPNVDQIVVIKNGYVSELGTFDELISKNGYFAEFVTEYLLKESDNDLEKQVIYSSLKDKLCVKKVTNQTNSEFKKSDSKNDWKSEREISNTSSVGLKIYAKYIHSIGLSFCSLIIMSSIASIVAQILSGLWLSEWSDDSLDANKINDTNLRYIRLGVYAGIGVFDTMFTIMTNIFICLGCLRAAIHLHNVMLNRILKAPLLFYDTTPNGQILNRFSRDIDSVDISLVFSLRMTIPMGLRIFVSLLMITFQTYIICIAIFPLLLMYYYILKIYIRSSRQLKRIESTTRSPIYSHFSETVSGSASIRAYGVSHQFIQESNRRVDANHMCYYQRFTATCWLTISLEFLGSIIVLLTAIFVVLNRYKLSPGIAGLAISYSLNITSVLKSFVKSASGLETNIVSVERCLEYTETPTEAEGYDEITKPSSDWPERGEIKFKDYSTRYREGLDLVLKSITLEVKPKEKVGIVGRTGAGKSSLTLALFRLIEPVDGSIFIDSVDIRTLGLYDLRSRLTIIPQDPALFTGTLPLLRRTKILVLDEATAAVDMETDDLIQETIRKEFCLSTIVTIAHRLNTIIDYDKVLVMDEGMVAEFDSPQHLLADTNSIFYSMAKEANLV